MQGKKMDQETKLYERVVSAGGRVKYVPHSTEWDMRGMGPGHYHVWVNGSCTSIRSGIDPDFIAVDAAILEVSEAMSKAMLDRERDKPCREMDSETEAKGWLAFRKATGHDEPLWFGGCSMQDVVDAGVAVLRDRLADAQKV